MHKSSDTGLPHRRPHAVVSRQLRPTASSSGPTFGHRARPAIVLLGARRAYSPHRFAGPGPPRAPRVDRQAGQPARGRAGLRGRRRTSARPPPTGGSRCVRDGTDSRSAAFRPLLHVCSRSRGRDPRSRRRRRRRGTGRPRRPLRAVRPGQACIRPAGRGVDLISGTAGMITGVSTTPRRPRAPRASSPSNRPPHRS